MQKLFQIGIILIHLSVHRLCSCQDGLTDCAESGEKCWNEDADLQIFVHGDETLPPMTSGSRHVLVPSQVATWIRNFTVLLFSDHGGLVKDSAQELLNAGVPRENIFCVVSRYYAHVLQREYALDADLCTPPDWAGAALRFLNRDFPRRHAEYAADRPTRMNWTVIEDPAFIGAFADRFCPAVAAFDVVWVDIPAVFAALVAPCARGGAARAGGRRPRLVLRLGHRCKIFDADPSRHTHTHTRPHDHTHTRPPKYKHTHAHAHANTCTCTRTHTHAHTHTVPARCPARAPCPAGRATRIGRSRAGRGGAQV